MKSAQHSPTTTTNRPPVRAEGQNNSRSRRLLQPPLLHRNPLEQNKPLPIENLLPHRPQKPLKLRQREQFLETRTKSAKREKKNLHPKTPKPPQETGRKDEKKGKQQTLAIAVNPLPLPINPSAAPPNSSISSLLKACVHRSGWSR